jgi:hypothetical protein
VTYLDKGGKAKYITYIIQKAKTRRDECGHEKQCTKTSRDECVSNPCDECKWAALIVKPQHPSNKNNALIVKPQRTRRQATTPQQQK